MARYTLQVADGRKVTLEAPDDQTAVQGAADWASANPTTPPELREKPAAPTAPVLTPEQQRVRTEYKGAGPAIDILNGLSFNNADRLAGGADAIAAWLSGKDAHDAYVNTRDAVRAEQATFDNAHPYVSFGLNLLGGVPLGEAAGGVAAMSKLPVLAKAIGVGAGMGAGYGAGADKSDPLRGALVGGTEGAVIGGAAPFVANAARGGAQMVSRMVQGDSPQAAEKAANRWLSARLSESGLSPADITGDPRVARGAPVTTAEVMGRNAMGDVNMLTRRPGVAGDLADETLIPRDEARSDRLNAAFEAATGVAPSDARAGVEAVVSKGRMGVNPAYADIRAQQGPVWNEDLATLAESDPHVKRAIAEVKANTRNAPETPDANMWLRVRQQLVDDVKRDPVTRKRLNADFNDQVDAAGIDLDAAMRKAIPGFAPAQDAAAGYKSVEGAFQRARDFGLFSIGKGRTGADFDRLWTSAKTDAERDAIRHALAADFLDAADNGRLQPSKVRNKTVQQKLRTAFGDDAADQLALIAQDERGMSDFSARARAGTNSVSAEALMRSNDVPDAADIRAGVHVARALAEGRPVRAAMAGVAHVAGNLAARAASPGSQAVRDAVATRYLSPAADFTMPASTRSIATAGRATRAAGEAATRGAVQGAVNRTVVGYFPNGTVLYSDGTADYSKARPSR